MIRRVFPARNGQATYQYGGADIPADSIYMLPAISRDGAAPEVEVSAKLLYAIQLDPEYTTPGLAIAVRPLGASTLYNAGSNYTVRVLRPGEVYTVPRGCAGFEFWNANGRIMDIIASAHVADNRPALGALAFLVTDDRDDIVRFVRDVQPRASVCLLNAGTPQAEGAIGVDFYAIPSGLALLRMTTMPVQAGGQIMDAPADFAVSLVPWILVPGVEGVAFHSTARLRSSADRPAGVSGGLWVPLDSVYAVSATQQSFLVSPPPGALAITFMRRGAIAGAGVAEIVTSIEAAG